MGLKADNPKWQAVEIFGPIEAPLSRIAGRYRWQMLLKSISAKALRQFARALVYENSAALNHKEVKVAIDVDPMMML
jgi:primosomal protein N' (replication factor Y)